MSATQVVALARQLLAILGGYLVGAGYLDATQSETLVGALAVIVGVGWSIFASRKAGVLSDAAKIPEVSEIAVTSHKLADKVTSDKVTS